MMEEAFDSFNAPQFVDFSKAPENLIEDSVDEYFDIDHESENMEKKTPENSRFFSPEYVPDSTVSPDELDPLEESYDKPRFANFRKSMSVGNLVLFNEEEFTPYSEDVGEPVQKLNNHHQNGEQMSEINSNQQKQHSFRSISTSSWRGKGSQDHLNKLAQPKRYPSVETLKKGNTGTGKFVSLAEAIITFQNRTPIRFRSKPNLAQNHCSQALFRTVPESPALQTKARSRPVHVLSQEEREKLEFENHQKFKIKAHPVNKKILLGPVKPTVPVEKKPPTKPQPFNLTSLPPKKTIPSPQKYEFRAKPMPRSAEKVRKSQEIERRPATKPKTPTFMKNYKHPMHKSEDKLTKDSGTKPADNTTERKNTKPVPFSFDDRDKMIEKRRQKLYDKYEEEARKAREFHAKPIPKSIYKTGDSIKSESGSSRGSSRRHPSSENLHVQFKARPATVLYKDPFIPVKPEKLLTEAAPFSLSTEQRAQEREDYERIRREREHLMEYYKNLEEEEKLRQEQEETARLRKETTHKAQPIKKYKEVHIQPSNKVTEPISPKFHANFARKLKNKENIPNNGNISC